MITNKYQINLDLVSQRKNRMRTDNGNVFPHCLCLHPHWFLFVLVTFSNTRSFSHVLHSLRKSSNSAEDQQALQKCWLIAADIQWLGRGLHGEVLRLGLLNISPWQQMSLLVYLNFGVLPESTVCPECLSPRVLDLRQHSLTGHFLISLWH